MYVSFDKNIAVYTLSTFRKPVIYCVEKNLLEQHLSHMLQKGINGIAEFVLLILIVCIVYSLLRC